MPNSRVSAASHASSANVFCLICRDDFPKGAQSRLSQICGQQPPHRNKIICPPCYDGMRDARDDRCPECRGRFNSKHRWVPLDSDRLDREKASSYALAQNLQGLADRGEDFPPADPPSRASSIAPSVSSKTSRHSNASRATVTQMNTTGIAGDRDRTPRASRAPSVSAQSISAQSMRSHRSHASRRSQAQPPMSPVEPSMPALDTLSISNDIEPMPAPSSMAGIPMSPTPGSVVGFNMSNSIDGDGEVSSFGAELMQSGPYTNPHPEYAQSTHSFENDAMSVHTFSDPVPTRERVLGARTNISRTSVASKSSIRTMMSDLSTTSTRTTIIRDPETNQPMISRSKAGQARKVSFAEKFAQYTLT